MSNGEWVLPFIVKWGVIACFWILLMGAIDCLGDKPNHEHRPTTVDQVLAYLLFCIGVSIAVARLWKIG